MDTLQYIPFLSVIPAVNHLFNVMNPISRKTNRIGKERLDLLIRNIGQATEEDKKDIYNYLIIPIQYSDIIRTVLSGMLRAIPLMGNIFSVIYPLPDYDSYFRDWKGSEVAEYLILNLPKEDLPDVVEKLEYEQASRILDRILKPLAREALSIVENQHSQSRLIIFAEEKFLGVHKNELFSPQTKAKDRNRVLQLRNAMIKKAESFLLTKVEKDPESGKIKEKGQYKKLKSEFVDFCKIYQALCKEDKDIFSKFGQALFLAFAKGRCAFLQSSQRKVFSSSLPSKIQQLKGRLNEMESSLEERLMRIVGYV